MSEHERPGGMPGAWATPTLSQRLQTAQLRDESFRLLVEQAQDYAIFMLDPDGRIATWNQGAERTYRYTAAEIVGQHFSRFYSDQERAAGKPEWELEQALAAGRTEDEGWRVRKDGSRFWATVVITALHDLDGNLLGFAKVTRDLSTRREAEERYRLFVEQVRDYAMFLLDLEGRVETWNPGAERLYGYAADEIIGSDCARFYEDPDGLRRLGKLMVQATEHGSAQHDGWRVRKDGSRFWANVTLAAVHNPDGTPRGFAKVTRDATEQRRLHFLGEASTLLGASLDYQETLRDIPQLCVPYLADWCVIYQLEGGALRREAMAHAHAHEIALGEELNRRYPPTSESDAVWRVARTGRTELYSEITDDLLRDAIAEPEHLRLTRALGLRSVLIVPLAYHDRVLGDRVLGALTLAYTESARRYRPEDVPFVEELARRCAMAIENARAHRELQIERQFLDTVVRQMPEAVAILEREGQVMRLNEEAQRLMRQPKPKARSAERDEDYPLYYMDGRRCPASERPSARALRGAEVLDEEFELEVHGGERTPISASAAPVRIEGRILGAVSLFKDITERRRALQRAQEEAYFRERFVGILGHDLRNPLSAIIASAQLLTRLGRQDLADKGVRAAKRILDSADRMTQMIADVLDLTRARLGGGIPVVPKPVDLAELSQRVLDELRVARRGSQVHFEAHGDLHARLDPARIEQVLSNLVGNALQYGGNQARVVLRDRGEHLRIDIHNAGTPIPTDLRPHLFDPFSRPAKAEPSGGLGLGLYIAHQIVLAHGGTLAVHSTAEEGTTFRVLLPRHPAP